MADRYGITRAEAAEFLGQIEGWIAEAQTRKGWEVISDRRDEMPDARTEQQKAAWERAQEDAGEQAGTGRYW